MKHILSIILIVLGSAIMAQTVKSKPLKLKYTTPEGWSAEEFGGKTSWDESGNALCRCSGASFVKQHKDGKLHVVIYPSTPNGLDSAKHDMVGSLVFVPVEKLEKTTNKKFSFEKRRSNFKDSKTGAKSYEVIKLKAKVEDHYYLIYLWQENPGILSLGIEKEMNEMVNAIEPI